ncbi:MAG: hypothetical protein IJ836_05890 [Spirochaetales bacterium]|nr:hypothetical protein [Spirochaetales bacterium]MDR2815259.1 hypothetical protein [Proteiniphilum sp.]
MQDGDIMHFRFNV